MAAEMEPPVGAKIRRVRIFNGLTLNGSYPVEVAVTGVVIHFSSPDRPRMAISKAKKYR